MSEQEKFLKRWSRRKREGEAAPAADDKPASTALDKQRVAARDPAAGSPPAPAKDEAPFDLASLPSLDSIGPSSDIRAFLQPGVPAALSRAALRRAWVADPAIRDFVGLAENAWDFTATNEAMGFGPLNMDAAQIAEQVKMVFGEAKPEREEPAEPEAAQIPQSAPQDATVRRSEPAALPVSEEKGEAETTGTAEPAAAKDADSDQDAAPQNEAAAPAAIRRRPHGGALPR